LRVRPLQSDDRGWAASTAKLYKVEFTTSRGCIATQAGAFCLLRGAADKITNISYVSASFGECPEGAVYSQAGYNAARVIVTGLNSSFNHAQGASAYYIGRHKTLDRSCQCLSCRALGVTSTDFDDDAVNLGLDRRIG
jgi:hypothetical protein